MDYGMLFRRAWDIIWKNKFLILLGMLVVLGSAGGNGGAQGSLSNLSQDRPSAGPPQFQYQAPFRNVSLGGIEIAILVIIALILVLVVVGLWVLSVISRGGLIHGAATLDAGGNSSFGQAFSEGWNRGLRLIGIGLVPAIPTVLLMAVSAIAILGYTGIEIVNGPRSLGLTQNWLLIPALLVICFLVFASLVLALLRTFADRACMLEDLGIVASYRRGFEVLGENLGSALVLFILQIVLSLVIGLILLGPGIVVVLCCLLWPLLLIVQGTFSAYYSTLWTLAWSRWTGGADLVKAEAA
jgi:hypothetical protein